MDFFGHQERAQRNTSLLLAYFALAVAAVVVSIYAVVQGLLLATDDGRGALVWWDRELFVGVALVTVALIALGSLYKSIALAIGGGAAVAEALGAREIARESEAPLERRLLNVVDEMAIASGVPSPRVYLLEHEMGINAFAAGTRPDQAVVAVTRGTLEKLDRDELQGVVAHEFSHILHGDMRLNLRLIGVLHGILLIALVGRMVVRGGSRARSKNSGQAVLFGLALTAVGYIGLLFGRLIQSAVSRQREFLADAAAVQFTRNPAGIAGALKKIGGIGSTIDHPEAEEVAHLFFGDGLGRLSGLFATHPPLEERIRRIDPHFAARAGDLSNGLPGGIAGFSALDAPSPMGSAALSAMAGRVEEAHIAYAHTLLESFPAEIREGLATGEGACRVIYTLLLDERPAVAEGQLAEIGARDGEEARRWCERRRGWVGASPAGPRSRLAAVNLALPVLAGLSPHRRMIFIETVDALAAADRRETLFEFTLASILAAHLLDGDARRARRRRVARPSVTAAGTALFAALAYSGGDDGDGAAAAFHAALEAAGLSGAQPVPGTLTLDRLEGALQRLEGTHPDFKRRLVEGCAAAVAVDGRVTVEEGELLRAVCSRLGVPTPPLLPGQ